jgi:hypothetical protein
MQGLSASTAEFLRLAAPPRLGHLQLDTNDTMTSATSSRPAQALVAVGPRRELGDRDHAFTDLQCVNGQGNQRGGGVTPSFPRSSQYIQPGTQCCSAVVVRVNIDCYRWVCICRSAPVLPCLSRASHSRLSRTALSSHIEPLPAGVGVYCCDYRWQANRPDRTRRGRAPT